jgi:hypothetical protein
MQAAMEKRVGMGMMRMRKPTQKKGRCRKRRKKRARRLKKGRTQVAQQGSAVGLPDLVGAPPSLHPILG